MDFQHLLNYVNKKNPLTQILLNYLTLLNWNYISFCGFVLTLSSIIIVYLEILLTSNLNKYNFLTFFSILVTVWQIFKSRKSSKKFTTQVGNNECSQPTTATTRLNTRNVFSRFKRTDWYRFRYKCSCNQKFINGNKGAWELCLKFEKIMLIKYDEYKGFIYTESIKYNELERYF